MAATLCLSSIQASSAADPLPKIILMMADDQGWGDTAYNGHPFVPTPALDAMAIGLNFFDNDPYLSRNGKVEQRKGKGSVTLMDDPIAGKVKKRSKPLGF